MSEREIIYTSEGVGSGSRVTEGLIIQSAQKVTRVTDQSHTLPEYIVENTNGIFINLESFSTPEAFRESLDLFFRSGYYFLSIDYNLISGILFDFENTKKSQLSLDTIRPRHLVKIASGITKFDFLRQSFYRKLLISRDNRSVDYFFEPIFIDTTDDQGKKIEQEQQLSVDEFIAFMWNQGICSGIDTEGIKQAIIDKKKGLGTIAKEKPPTESIDPIMKNVISFEIKQGPKNGDSNTRTDLLTYEQGYVRTDADMPIFKKVPGKIGDIGWTIYGKPILPKPIQDFSIQNFVGTGVYVREIDGVEYLYSEYNGFPRLEEGPIIQGRMRVNGLIRVHVDVDKVFQKIGMPTGHVSVEEGIVSEMDVELDILNAKTVHAKSNVSANINTQNDITIDGNVHGTACSNILSRKHQRVGAISRGNIVSENGNITIGGISNDVYLVSKQGKIHVSKIANSLIVAKTVEITDAVFNCTILADTVILHGRTVGCRIIAKNIILAESSEKGQYENICSVFVHDLTPLIERNNLLRAKAIEQIQLIESAIDKDIVTRFKSFEKLETGKRISMTRILVELMGDPEKQKDPKYAGYVQVYKMLEGELRKHGTNWKKITELNNYLTELSSKIALATTFMQDQQASIGVTIKYITAMTHIRQLNYIGDMSMLDFLPEQIMDIAELQIGGDMAQYCKINPISTISSGKFDWKSA